MDPTIGTIFGIRNLDDEEGTATSISKDKPEERGNAVMKIPSTEGDSRNVASPELQKENNCLAIKPLGSGQIAKNASEAEAATLNNDIMNESLERLYQENDRKRQREQSEGHCKSSASVSKDNGLAHEDSLRKSRYMQILETRSASQEDRIKKMTTWGERQKTLTSETIRKVMTQIHASNAERDNALQRAELAEFHLKQARAQLESQNVPGGPSVPQSAGTANAQPPSPSAQSARSHQQQHNSDWRSSVDTIDRRIIFLGVIMRLGVIFGTVGVMPPRHFIKTVVDVESQSFNAADSNENYHRRILAWLDSAVSGNRK